MDAHIDADGWIRNTGTEPVVPDGYRLDVKYRRGNIVRGAGPISGGFRWSLIGAEGDIEFYRQVLMTRAVGDAAPDKIAEDQNSRVYRGATLDAVQSGACGGCYFWKDGSCRVQNDEPGYANANCVPSERADSISVIWVERKSIATSTPPDAPIAAPEVDPAGKDPHTPGAKLDAGKIRPGLVLGGFARALKEVARVGTYGAQKYTENGWVLVPNGIDRYDDAMLRHWLDEHCGVARDADTELLHAAHVAWNALARLDLLVRQSEGGAE